MTWNYRIMKRKSEDGYEYYALNEVFYNPDKSLKAYSLTDEVIGDSPAEIIAILQMMLRDALKDRPVLTEEDFKEQYPVHRRSWRPVCNSYSVF